MGNLQNMKRVIDKDKPRYSMPVQRGMQHLRQVEGAIRYSWGGIPRLCKIVSKQTAMRYAKAEYLYKEAIFGEDEDKMLGMISMMERAYSALVKEAKEMGYQEVDGKAKAFEVDGKVWFVTDYDHELEKVRINNKDLYPETEINYTSVEELFRAVPQDVWEVKRKIALDFPGSTFGKWKKK